MNLFERMDVTGNQMQILRTHPNHLPGRYEPLPERTGEGGFQQALINSLNEVNGLQRSHEALSVQSIIAPESVEAHDLTIAAAKANTSLSITRNVVDRVIQAYRDITNLR